MDRNDLRQRILKDLNLDPDRETADLLSKLYALENEKIEVRFKPGNLQRLCNPNIKFLVSLGREDWEEPLGFYPNGSYDPKKIRRYFAKRGIRDLEKIGIEERGQMYPFFEKGKVHCTLEYNGIPF